MEMDDTVLLADPGLGFMIYIFNMFPNHFIHFSFPVGPISPPLHLSSSPVWRLSAAAPGEDPAQHRHGESRRRMDGIGRVPGEERSLQR